MPTPSDLRAALQSAAEAMRDGADSLNMGPGISRKQAAKRLNDEAGLLERLATRLATPLPEGAAPSLDVERHRHRYALVPVWTKDGSAIDSWWWCTDHPTGEWARIEDDPEAVAAGAIAP